MKINVPVKLNYENQILSYDVQIAQDKEYKISNEEKTRAKSLYSSRSLLSQMVRKNIGTKATRFTIMNSLLDNKMVIRAKQDLILSYLGTNVVEYWLKHCPYVLSEKMTSDLEAKITKVKDLTQLSREEKDMRQMLTTLQNENEEND